jgi:hypothetical protein
MCSRTLHAPDGNAGAWVILLSAVVLASGAAPAAAVPAAVVPVGATVDQFELPPPGESSPGETDLHSSFGSAAAAPQAAPVVVPLPPALGTGLAGFAAMALLRVGRRVYRRR